MASRAQKLQAAQGGGMVQVEPLSSKRSRQVSNRVCQAGSRPSAECVRLEPRTVAGRRPGRKSWPGALWLVVPALLCPKAALAIPSPDLAINFTSNAAQLLGLATVLFGGAAVGRRRVGLANNQTSSSRLPSRFMRWVLGALGLLFVISVGSNIFLWTQKVDDQNRRLEMNLVRPSVEGGEKVGDVNLKTLSYSDQVNHPLGITTEQLDQLLQRDDTGEESPINFIDVREPEEQEVAWLRGFTPVRYPDLIERRNELMLGESKNILICESGNRSSELCEQLAAMGIDCSFIVGGYGKWRAENRAVGSLPSSHPTTQRDVPDYPNKTTLLDTPEVKRMVSEESATFVDVRYPMEFEQGHLPQAINIPIRKLQTEEMWARLKEVPAGRPVIAPCYDKRSCFYSMVLGIRLHRLGYDYRGRYTVPHEYYVPAKPAPFESTWLGVNDRSWVARASAPFEALLTWTQGRVGPLWAAILLVVLLLRLAILPFTAKAERDQHVLRGLSDRIADLKQRLSDDRTRLSRAIRGLYRKHRLTPGMNLVSICLQIPMFLIFFYAVGRVSEVRGGGLLWIPSLGGPDPYCVLPVALGLLVFLHLHLSAANHSAWRIGLRAAAGIGLTSITLHLGAGVNLYLVFSTTLMMLQSQVVRHVLKGRTSKSAGAKEASAPRAASVVALAEADQVAGCGNKAARLARMIRAGIPVPQGLVLTDGMLRNHIGGHRRVCEHDAWANVPWQNKKKDLLLAVRSSGLSEDGESRSYAGVFESVLEVRPSELPAAIRTVWASMSSARATAYAGDEQQAGGVIIQEMIDAEYAGVLFTEHPARPSCMFVELVSGLGQAVADGTVAPEGYVFGRYSGRSVDGQTPPIDLGPLLALARRAEELFEGPQDIEWAYHNGRFVLLQSRDITAKVRDASADPTQFALEAERQRLLEIASAAKPDDVVFAQTELCELLPRPTPFSLSFMQALFAPGGSADLACRALGIGYNATEDTAPYVTTAFGALYLNRQEEKSRFAGSTRALSAFRLSRAAESLEKDYFERFVPAFLAKVRLLEAIDVSRLGTDDLLDLFETTCDEFLTDHYVQADKINIAADFYMKAAERQLSRKGLSASTYLAHLPETVVHRAMAILPEVRDGRRSISDFLSVFGHRAPSDYEFAQPRYNEDEAAVERLLERGRGELAFARAANDVAPVPKQRSLALAVERACRYQALKEEAKHYALRELAVIRRLLVGLDQRLSLDGGIFYLTLQEVPQLRDAGFAATAAARIAERRALEDAFRKVPMLPSELSLSQLEALALDGSKAPIAISAEHLQGTLVAGEAPVEGRARVVFNGEIVTLEKGEILVARYLHPDWTPAFPRAAGIIAEVGGWLSHAAIVAREYNVPTIVGARGALDRIETGDTLRLHSDGRVEAVS